MFMSDIYLIELGAPSFTVRDHLISRIYHDIASVNIVYKYVKNFKFERAIGSERKKERKWAKLFLINIFET